MGRMRKRVFASLCKRVKSARILSEREREHAKKSKKRRENGKGMKSQKGSACLCTRTNQLGLVKRLAVLIVAGGASSQ